MDDIQFNLSKTANLMPSALGIPAVTFVSSRAEALFSSLLV